jgi:hypothetical protein
MGATSYEVHAFDRGLFSIENNPKKTAPMYRSSGETLWRENVDLLRQRNADARTRRQRAQFFPVLVMDVASVRLG